MNSALRLYRRVLKLHKHLPLTSKALGDQYVKNEFRRHKNANPDQITKFIQEWKIYADLLERQQQQGDNFGSNISEEYLQNIDEDQLYQLYALHQEITNTSEGSDANKKD